MLSAGNMKEKLILWVSSLDNFFKYGIIDVEQLYPFERDIYYEMLIQHLEEQKEKEKTATRGIK